MRFTGWAARRSIACYFMFSVIGCLSSRAVLAVPVADYITVQPIDVCSGAAGTTTGCAPINNLGQNYATAAAGNIGSIDVTSSGDINVTRAIWNQIGIDLTFLPAVQDPNAGSFLTVAVTSCAANGTDCQSPQFQTLSDQANISQGMSPSPAPPLSQNSTTVNAFFINGLSPPAGTGTLYGLAWVNNNGIAIASNSLLGLGARPDTLAHEIGHDLDLNHTTFGAGAPNNLLTAGNTRLLPTSPASAISGLAAGTTDQLLATQQAQVLLSGFINPIPNVTTSATDPLEYTDFNVSFVNGGRPGEKLDTLTLTAPAGFLFPFNTFVDVFNNPDGLTVDPTFTCTESGCTSLVFDFTQGLPFVAGDSIDYSLCVPEDGACVPILVDELAGGTYTYNFETDVNGVPVELFQTTSELQPVSPGDLFSGSQFPDLSIPSEILNPNTFVGFNAFPCTPVAGSCPPLVLEDAFPPDEDQPVPEPSALLVLLSALAALSVACQCSSRLRCSSVEAGFA